MYLPSVGTLSKDTLQIHIHVPELTDYHIILRDLYVFICMVKVYQQNILTRIQLAHVIFTGYCALKDGLRHIDNKERSFLFSRTEDFFIKLSHIFQICYIVQIGITHALIAW